MSLGRQAVEEGREDMYSVFYLRVKEAEACAEIYAVEAWRSHLDRDWRACKDYLARRFPDRWADQRRVTIGVEREMDHMFRELEQKLPADLFAIVVRELQDMQRDDDVESDD